MSERLDELRRQRALLQQHLEWLDAQIAADALEDQTHVTLVDRPRFNPSPAPAALQPQAKAAAYPTVTPAFGATAPEQILQQFRQESQSSPQKVKLGCWVAFFSAFVVLGTIVLGWYYLSTAAR